VNLKKAKNAKTYATAALILAAIVLGATWATTSQTATISVDVGGVDGALFSATPANKTAGQYTPTWTPIAGAVGTVNNGSLYNITVADTGRYMITLFYTNPDQLIQAYSYLNLNITIYQSSAVNESTWKPTATNAANATQYLTLSSARVILYVGGPDNTATSYIVRVDGGIFYCTSTKSENNLMPSFYILVDQA